MESCDTLKSKSHKWKCLDEFMQNEENAYNTDANEAAYRLMDETKEKVRKEAQEIAHLLNNPVFLAAQMHRTVQERENANRLLQSILEKIDAKFAQMDERIARLEEKIRTQDARPETGGTEDILLPKQDEDILGLVRRKGHVCAEEVRKEFGYRGTNAASARLSKLYQMGLLQKQQVGRKMYYKMR